MLFNCSLLAPLLRAAGEKRGFFIFHGLKFSRMGRLPGQQPPQDDHFKGKEDDEDAPPWPSRMTPSETATIRTTARTAAS